MFNTRLSRIRVKCGLPRQSSKFPELSTVLIVSDQPDSSVVKCSSPQDEMAVGKDAEHRDKYEILSVPMSAAVVTKGVGAALASLKAWNS